MSVLSSKFAGVFAAATLLLLGASAQATTITTHVTEVDPDGNGLGGFTSGAYGSIAGLGAFTSVDLVGPSLTSGAKAGGATPGGPISIASGESAGQIDYAITFSGTGASGLSGSTVPLVITYAGYTGVYGDSRAIAKVSVYDSMGLAFFAESDCSGHDTSACGAFSGTAVSFDYHVGSSTGYVELVSFAQASASASYGPGQGSAYATIDPTISLAKAFANAHPGLIVTASASPEPDAWALMLVGVGGMGAALRTRRRKAVTA